MAMDLEGIDYVIKGTDKFSSVARNVDAGMDRLAKSYGRLLGLFSAGLGVGIFTSAIKDTIDFADRMNDLTQSLGINMQELAKYKLATEQSGTTLEGLGKGIKGLTNAFAEHGDELRAAGLTAKTADGQIRQIADLFAKMPDGLEKTTLATKLFGKYGMELIPMLNLGAKGLDEAAEKSAKYAAMMATLGPQADKFNDTMVELGMASKVAGMSLIDDALPAMTGIAAAMTVAAHESNIFMVAFVGIGGYVTEGLSGWGRALHMYWLQLNAYLDDAAAKMMRFLGASKDAAMFANSANEYKLQVQQLLEQGPSAATPPAIKQFDTAAWMEQYKKLIEALGLGKKATEDSDSTYRGLLKTLKEKLLTDRDLTEVSRLQLSLDALSAKQLKTITPEREAELKALAAQLDLRKRLQEQWENDAKNEDALAKMRKEGAAAKANYDNAIGALILTADKNIQQMQFETGLIGLTNVEREKAISLRQMETDKIDAQTIARMQEAISAKNAAEQDKASQVGIWQSAENAGHQAFLSIFDTGKSVIERLHDLIKTSLIDLLYQMTIKKWVINLAVGASGAGVAESAFGSAGSSAAGSGLFSAGSSLYNMGAAGMADYAAGFATTAMASQATTAALIESGTVGYAGAGMEAGAAATGSLGFAAAVPYIGAAVLALYALGAFGSDDNRQAQLIGTGITGQITRSGLQGGTIASNFGTAPNDRWGDTVNTPIAADALKQFNLAITKMFSDATDAAKTLGLSTDALSGITTELKNSTLNGDQVQTDFNAALQTTADTIAKTLMPNIADFQQSGESLAQTFGRLAAAQAALNAQRGDMEIELMKAQGNAAGALAAEREKELAAMDATLRPLQEMINAANDMAEAAKAAAEAQAVRLTWMQQWDVMIGATTAKQIERESQLASVTDEATKVWMKAVFALQDINSHEAQQTDLLNQLDILQGRTTQKAIDRANTLAGATDDANRQLMEMVFAMQDQIDATATLAAEQKAASDEQLRAAEQLQGIYQSINATIQSLYGGTLSPLSPADKLAQANATLGTTYTAALGGDMDSLRALSQVATQFLDASRAYNASSQAYSDDFSRVIGMLRGVQVPGHASGLDYVPYDNYLMRAHQGEAVLNRVDAAGWRNGSAGITSADLAGLREELRGVNGRLDRLTAVVEVGDRVNVEATKLVAQTNENIAWKDEVKPKFR